MNECRHNMQKLVSCSTKRVCIECGAELEDGPNVYTDIKDIIAICDTNPSGCKSAVRDFKIIKNRLKKWVTK